MQQKKMYKLALMTAQSYSPWSFSWKQLYEDPRKNNWVKQGSNCFISFVVHHCHCHDEPSHSTSCIDNAAITQPCLLYSTTGYNNMRTPYSNIWYIYIIVLIHTHTTWSLKQQQKNPLHFPFLFTQGHFFIPHEYRYHSTTESKVWWLCYYPIYLAD